MSQKPLRLRVGIALVSENHYNEGSPHNYHTYDPKQHTIVGTLPSSLRSLYNLKCHLENELEIQNYTYDSFCDTKLTGSIITTTSLQKLKLRITTINSLFDLLVKEEFTTYFKNEVSFFILKDWKIAVEKNTKINHYHQRLWVA